MTEIISDLEVKKLQLIDDKYDNVKVKEIRLESTSLVIRFRNVVEKFQRKKLKFQTFDLNGEFWVQSDGLKIVIDLHHKSEYDTFLLYFGDFKSITSNKKDPLPLSSSQQPDLMKGKLLLSTKKSDVKISKPPGIINEQTLVAIYDSSPALRLRIRPDYNPDLNKFTSFEDSPLKTESHNNTGSTISTGSKGEKNIVVEEKKLDLKSDLRSIPILHDQEKILSLPKSSKKVYQPGILAQLPLAKLDEPKALTLSPQEPVASTDVKNTYGSKHRAWNFFKHNISKPPLPSTVKKDYTDAYSDNKNDNDSIEDGGDSPKRLPLPKPEDSSTGSTRKITEYCKPTSNWNSDDLLNLSSSSTKCNKVMGDAFTPLQDEYSYRKSVGGIRNMGNTCYLSAILQALLANNSFCDDLTSQFWSHTGDICENVRSEVSPLMRGMDDNGAGAQKEEKENVNPVATPSYSSNVFQSYAFGSNDRQSVTPTVAWNLDSAAITTPSSPLNDGSSYNRTTVGPKNTSQEACKRYSTFSCLRETIDVVSQKRKLSSNGDAGITRRLFYSNFSDRTINVANLKKAVEHFSHQFRGYRQQDAHEFLTDMLNLIHEEMTTIILLFFDKLGSIPTRDVLVDRTEELSSGFKRPLPTSYDHQSFSNSNSSSSSSNGKRKYDSNELIAARSDEGSGTAVPSEKAAERLSLVCHHFESAVQNSFSCVSCGHQRQPKHETYRVFSIDIEYHKDRVPNVRDCTTSSPAPHTTLQSTPITTPIRTYLAFKRPRFNTILSDDDDDDDPHRKETPQALQLKSLFGNFFNDDIRDLVCERCQESDGRVRITSEIVTLPTTLVIHLKRFRYEEATERYVKINTPVSFPVELNLLDCGDCIKHRDSVQCQSLSSDIWTQRPREIKTSAADFESFFPSPGRMPSKDCGSNDEGDPFFTNHPAIGSTAENQRTDRQLYAYTLSAVVRHIGREMLTGHYVCDAASQPIDDCDLTGDLLWKRYDDACVTDIEQDKVLEEQDTPYILFYTKSTQG